MSERSERMFHIVKIPLALRARYQGALYNIGVHSTIRYGTSERSERGILNSIRYCESLPICAHVSVCNDLTKTLVVLPNTDYTKSIEIQF